MYIKHADILKIFAWQCIMFTRRMPRKHAPRADSRGRIEALRASPWFSERCGEMGRIFDTIKLNSPWAIHIFIFITQVYEILKG